MKAFLHTLLILCLTIGGLTAQTVWTGNVDSDWQNDGNWSAGSPTSGMTITIPGTPAGGNFPVFAGDPVIDFNIQNAGTLTFNTLVYNSGDIINFVGGTIINDGQFFNSGGGTIDNDGFFKNNSEFTNYGSFDSALSGETTVAVGATFTHAGLFFKSAGPFINNGNVVNTSNMRSTNIFENFGTLTNYNSFEAPFGSTFSNHSSGVINNLTGTIFVVNGTFTNDALITNDGDFSIQSATIGTNNSTITNNGLLEVAGALTNANTITNNSELSITDGGTLTNNATLTNNGTITLSICGTLIQDAGASNNIAAAVLNDGLIFLLSGTVNWTNVEFGNEFTDLSETKPPVAGCRGAVIFLDENGQASITTSDIDKGSYGSCGATIASVSLDRTDFTTADLGAQSVTLTVEDNLGKVSTCDAVVTVLAYVPPVVPVDDPDVDFNCPPDITVTALPGAGNAEATWTAPTATSSCSNGGGGNTNSCNIPNTISGYVFIGELNGSKYFISDHTANWHVARENAINNGGHLTVINNAAENTFIKNNITQNTTWLGYTDQVTEGTFLWDNGDTANYTNWNSGEPNDEDPSGYGADFAAFINSDGLWRDRKGTNDYYYTIEVPCPDALPSCSTVNNSLAGYTFIGEFNDSKYFYSNASYSWINAQTSAQGLGGNLAIITSVAENDFIKNVITANSWIGYSDATSEGNFTWINGEASTYTNWGAGEPNNIGNEDYTEIQVSGFWNDLTNGNNRRAVIEFPCSSQTTCEDVNLNFVFDNYPEDISWDVVDNNGTTIAWGGNYGSEPNGSSLTETFCLTDGCYDLNIYDSYGDGLCCAYGNGSYSLVDADGAVLASGATFTTGETTNFCISNGNPPTGGDPVVTQIRGPQSGQQFPVGATEIAYEVTDPCGNLEICTFEVTVDATPSEITLTDCPSDLTINTDPGATSAVIDWADLTGTTTCFNGGLEIKQAQGPDRGSVLRVKDGPQLVAYNAIDSCGNFKSCVFTVTVVATPSAITMANCPNNIDLVTLSGETSAIATWTAPTATTTCFTGNINVQQLDGPASGSAFPVNSSTRIIYLLSDECGNTEICIFFVNVSSGCLAAGTACDDNDPKTISDQEDGNCNCAGTLTTLTIDCPIDITIDALPGANFAVVNWTDATANTDCNTGSVTINKTAGPDSGDNLPVGTTTVTYEATDGCTNTTSCSFNITVNATSSTMTLDCPADISVAAIPGDLTAQVNWVAPVPTSDCTIQPVNLIQTAGPANGASFLEGTTTVSYEATDGCGESVTCSFTVTVSTSCVDDDGDGVCADDDCDDTDASIPAAPGTTCDDGDATTENDVILADGCSCAGTPIDACAALGGDSDGDGVCADDDCDDSDASIPAAPGTTCDDGDATTENDVILADGCTCAGTPINNDPDCADIVITPGNGSITVSGLTGVPITTIQVFNAVWTEVFNCAGNCDPNEQVITGLAAETHFVKVGFYNATWSPICSVEDYYEVGAGDPCENLGGDADGDGVCAADDCDDTDASIPAAQGTSCDDGDADTTNDVILADGCTCAGTPPGGNPCDNLGGDSDGDGVCALDDCDDTDASLPAAPGTTCDDGDANTSNDQIQADGCTCAGTPAGPDCANITITPGDGFITVSGLNGAPISTLQVFDPVWTEVFNCAGNCNDTELISGLAAGNYFVKAVYYTATWAPICSLEDVYTVTDGSGDPCENFGGDADGDGVCAQLDCDDTDASLPAAEGTACDDGDANTTNDQILADGCTCEGTIPGSGPDCANITVTVSADTIIVGGLDGASITTVQIFDPYWSEVFNCAGNCDPVEEKVHSLVDGTYFVKVGYYDATWSPICTMEDYYTVLTSSPQTRRIINFEAEKGVRQVDLMWGSNTGASNDHFEVERSIDGVNFETLLIRSNEFTGEGTYFYEEADANPVKGWNHYRLKQVHVDGTYVITAERRILFEEDVHEFTLFPNPVEEEVFVHLKSFEGEATSIEIYNGLGQLVVLRQLDFAPAGPIGINVAALQAGVYSVSVKVAGKKRLTKLLVITRR